MSTRMHGRTTAADPAYSYRTLFVRVVVAGESVGGTHSILEHTLPPGRLPMPRLRSRASTTFLVSEGVLSVEREGVVYAVRDGSALTVLAGEWHARWNAGDDPVHFYEIVAPGGIEAYYREIAGVIADRRPADVLRVLEISARHGLEFDVATLYDLVERYQLELI